MVVIWGLTAAVIALQIPYPLVHGDARHALTVVTVVVFATASTAHAARIGTARAAAALLLVAGVGGFAAEVLGVHAGVPFGDYRYTGGLGPTLASVPVVVALAWVMMAHPARVVATRIVGAGWRRVTVGAVALAGWDVFLDPQMVDAGHWRWTSPDPHLPGISSVPLSNFGGWLLVSLVLMGLLEAASPVADAADGRPAVTLWTWTWLSSTLANVAFFGHPAVAGWGFAAMGLVGVPLLWSVTR
jgi:putative membrane protein